MKALAGLLILLTSVSLVTGCDKPNGADTSQSLAANLSSQQPSPAAPSNAPNNAPGNAPIAERPHGEVQPAHSETPIEVADPSRLMLQHHRYGGKLVQLTVRSQGGLSAHPLSPAYLYIDEYSGIDPLFDGAAVEKWISSGLNDSYNRPITITARVRPDKWGSNVVMDVLHVQLSR